MRLVPKFVRIDSAWIASAVLIVVSIAAAPIAAQTGSRLPAAPPAVVAPPVRLGTNSAQQSLAPAAPPGFGRGEELPRQLYPAPSAAAPSTPALPASPYLGNPTVVLPPTYDDYDGDVGLGIAESYPRGAYEDWTPQLLPDGLIYRSYLAGSKESRMASIFEYEKDFGWMWDITLGGRVGLFRYGTRDGVRPQGFQVDIEGSGQPRLNLEDQEDLIAADFRAGLPLTYGIGRWQTKFAYYHLSSHLGDEYMLKNPGFRRVNYSRDVLVLGQSYYLTDAVRLYGEIGWAFYSDVAEPWELQFGIDYSPLMPVGIRGAPFAAVNGQLRQELNFSGNFVAQAGWQWRGGRGGQLLRIGAQYYNGLSNQFELYNFFENKIGVGIWYDY